MLRRTGFRTAIILFGALAFFHPASAQPDEIKFLKFQEGGDFGVLSFKFNQVMTPHQVADTIGDAARNPWVREVIARAAGAAGVPPLMTEVALQVAAKQTAGGGQEERHYSVPFPSGWKFCHAQAATVSVVPADGKRAAQYGAAAHDNEITIGAWTPRRKLGEGRSWVESDFRVVLAREEKLNEYRAKGGCALPKQFIDCRGKGGGDRPACGTSSL
jgi:hypothetical protein